MSKSTKRGASHGRGATASPWTSRVIVGNDLGVEAPPDWLVRAYEAFRESVSDPAFPCFFGTTAERRGEMFYAFVEGDDWSQLGPTLARFCELSQTPPHQRSNFALFFEPRDVPLDHDAFRAFCWRVLQHLHDADPAGELDVDPTNPSWEFTAFGTQMFVVGCGPSYKNRRSRNFGPGIVMLFQPRAVFIDQVTKRAIGDEARAEVRRRLLAWDGHAHHPDLGVYGDPSNLEWRQYFLPDENASDLGGCPFRQRQRPAGGAADFVAVLRHQARVSPDKIAARFLSDAGDGHTLTYAELDAHARRIAEELLSHARPGDRAMILAPSGLEYLVAFFACCYAGVIAVPAYPPAKGQAQQLQRLVGMVRDARPSVLIVDGSGEANFETLDGLLDAGVQTLIVRADSLAASAWEPGPIDPQSVAFLQYTSGSTGAPKGVVVSHANLVANCAAAGKASGLSADDVMVSWLPLYHDMGLIGMMLASLQWGATFVFMSPHRVMQSPVQWLKAIAQHGGTVSGGPNFAYQLCLDRIKDSALAGLDLSRWRYAFCGSEPVRAATMAAFAERFALYGFDASAISPCYGLAEGTLVVSLTPARSGLQAPRFDAGALGRGEAVVSDEGAPVVDCGVVLEGHRVRVSDPSSGRECAEGEVGELWLAGPSVTGGYWQNPSASADVFRVVAREDGSEEKFLRTGDLGFLYRGRLFVNGRIKDTLVVRGQNLYPQDLEQTIYERVPGVRKGRAAVFPFENGGVEGVGVAVEASPAALASRGPEELLRAVARAVAGEHQTQAELVLLLRPGTLPRTSSGKIRRSACVPEWRSGVLAPIAVYRRDDDASDDGAVAAAPGRPARVAPRTATEHALANLWGEALGVRGVGVHDDFFEEGGDSLRGARLLARIQSVFNVDLPASSVFEARTIAAQATLVESPSRAERRPIQRREGARAPLSHGQQGLWFLWKLRPESAAYVLRMTLRFAGPLEADALRAAFALVIERHAILRTRFEEIDGAPWQCVIDGAALPWEEHDWSGEPAEAKAARLEALRVEIGRPFDLERGPLVRAALVRTGPGEHLLFLGVHHIAADGWSAGVLWRELAALYTAERDGTSPELDTLPIQFGDYAAWERDEGRRPVYEAQLAYWRDALAELRATAAPGRRAGAPGQGGATRRVSRPLRPELIEALRQVARAEGATLSMALLAALDVLLYRYGGGRDVSVGVASAARRRAEAQGLIGYFVNAVVHRTKVVGAAAFRDLLGQVRARALGAHANQDVPFERLVAALQPERRADEAPFFEVAFNHQPEDVERVTLAGLDASLVELDAGSPFDWALHVREARAGALISIDYRADRFDGAVTAQALDDYVAILEQIAADAGVRVGAIRLTGAAETAFVRPFRSVLERFTQQARERGRAQAVTCEGESIDYAGLDAWSDRVAARLTGAGVRADARVGLCVERSAAVVAGMLGVLKAGGAFVPLDPAYPAERLRTMLDGAGVRCVVADASTARRLEGVLAGRTIVSADAGGAEVAPTVCRPAHPEQLAYVIYTSGSTGRPKGVEISHRALALHVDDYVEAFDVDVRDAVLQFSTISFDAAIEQIFPALAAGARLVMRGPQVWSWAELNQTLEREAITLAFLPTGYWQQWLPNLPAHVPASLRRVRVGGEALAGDAAARWLEGPFGAVRLDNCYGPTECAVSTSAHEVGAADVHESAVPIGKSFLGRRAYVFDEDGADVPPGGVGELCIGGPGLARGYAGQPAATALRFVPEPERTGVEPGSRLYRTGDRCRRRLDGTFEFLGRLDEQVKLRGYRVELGEIEAALRAAGASEAFVTLGGEGGRRDLVAYVAGAVTPDALRDSLAQTLPAYMLPRAIVSLVALPRSPNGKLDRRALPAPPAPRTDAAVLPCNEREALLLAIWKQVLGRDDIGTQDNFFELGGDSILSVQIVARARAAGLSIALRHLFERPTVAQLAEAAEIVDEPEPATGGANKLTSSEALTALGLDPAAVQEIYPATPVQEGLLFHDAFEEAGGVYVFQARLTLRGAVDSAALRQAWELAVARHDVLRTAFVWSPEGGAVQVVYRKAALPYAEIDASKASDYDAYIAAFQAKELARGVDIGAAPLMRLALVVRPDGAHDLVWTGHHAILDGWSSARLVAEVLADHAALATGSSARASEPSVPFRTYVEWLRRRPSGEAWWQAELGRWDAPATVSQALGRPRHLEPGAHHLRYTLPAASVEALKKAAARARVTLHTLAQGAWALVLARYAGREQAVFGSTVSGRPPELAGVEQMVGLFINTLPVRVDTPATVTIDAWLRTVQECAAAVREHEQVRLADLQKWAGQAGESLFDSVLVFENYPISSVLGERVGDVAIEGVATVDRTHYPLTLTLYPRNGLELDWEWDGERVERAWVERLSAHYERVLAQLASSGDALVGELVVGKARPQAVTSYAFDPVGERVARAARSAPSRIALGCDGVETTHGTLDAWATRVGRALRSRGLGAEGLVGLCVGRSAALVAALLGVWKAGGAFVPLDPSYPEERLRAMLAGVRLVVCDAAGAARLPWATWGVETVRVDDLEATDEEGEQGIIALPAPPHPEQLAYVLYTSGSTGQPKGVAVSHRSLSLHVDDFLGAYGLGPDDRTLFSSTLNFDVALHELLPVLTRGGRAVMRGEGAWDLDTLTRTLGEQAVTLARVPTALWQPWARSHPPSLPSLRQVTVGGEGLSGTALAPWFEGALGQVALDNLYGPTEVTVASHRRRVRAEDGAEAVVSIGHAFAGRSSYVLDGAGNVVPVGGVGELCIGGVSVARGYLGRAGATAERFVPDPFVPGERLYRTGDRVRETTDGALSFLGRVDGQVKLRGQRIELGEVEAALRACAGVQEAAAAVVGEGEGRRLVGYAVGSASEEELRAAAERALPAVMVPTAFVRLEALPRLPNGKLDRGALPAPEARGGGERIEPRTALEGVLREVWQRVLKRAPIGVTENFFELGGDSILGLQVIARAREAGWRVTPKQVFEQPTVEALARVARPLQAKRRANDEVVRGDLPLTPIQARFFERFPEGPSHWNQSVMLRIERELSVDAIRRALETMVARHDALRLRFTRVDGAWKQRVTDTEAGSLVETFDLRDADDVAGQIASLGERVQRGLDLEHGPLVRAGYFLLPNDERRLLVVVHHLAVDGVSWRILLDEFEAAYAAIAHGEAPKLLPPSTPWSVWASHLNEYRARDEFAPELAWWKDALAASTAPGAAKALPGMSDGDRTYGVSLEIVWALNAADSQRLFDEAPRAYRMRVDEMLLAALTQTVAEWTGSAGALLDLEGHGREDVVDGVDVDRTVGWFTTRFPVWFEATGDAASMLKSAKERLRAVPYKGLHWGLFRASDTIFAPRPAVSFNYLGRFESSTRGGAFTLADEFAGSPIDGATEMAHALELNAVARDASLVVSWRFCPGVLDEATVRGLVASFDAKLRALLEHASSASPEWTASDFPLARLTQASLHALSVPLAQVQDIYPATPLQQGLIFESMLHPSQGAYVNQLRVTLRGELDATAMREAWRSVVARHDVLRTHFEWLRGERALQVVRRDVELPFVEHDWSSEPDYEARLAALCHADLARGFAMNEAPLLRVFVVRRPDGAHDLIRTSHHALSDGWSSQQLFGEILTEYAARRRGAPATLPPPVSYRDYVVWLQGCPSARAFWETKFHRVDDPARLASFARRPVGPAAMARPIERHLGESLSQRLREAARRYQVTLNTLMQGAWALVLGRMAGAKQALFGITVSGRPPELEGAERIVGPFINTLPAVVDLPPGEPVGEWLRRLQGEATELTHYEHTPLHELQRWVQRAGDELFDSIVVFENYPTDRGLLERATGLVVEHVQAVERTHYPLTLTVVPGELDVALEWAWDAGKVDGALVLALAGYFVDALEQLSAAEREWVGDIRFLFIDETLRDDARFRGAEARGRAEQVLPVQRIAEQARRRPCAEAIRCGGECMTYGALEASANRVALALAGARGERVGVCVERTVSLIAACLGVWKAGATFVPLDPIYPAERLRMMAAAAGVRRVVVGAEAGEGLALEGLTQVALSEVCAGAEAAPVEVHVHPDELAYVMFTSGSTGEPKAVGISHRALSLHVADCIEALGLHEADVVFQFSTLNFDAAIEQIFPTLAVGASLVMRGPELPDWAALQAVLAAESVSVIDLPTAYWSQSVEQTREPLPALRLVSIGGEAASPEALRRWQAGALATRRLVNTYGPTEATVSCLHHETSRADAERGSVPIGRPLSSRQAYVLDSDGYEVPRHGVGELCIGGEALARGYLGRPGATAAAFVPDPFIPGGRLYRTGDLCRVVDEGVIEFVGRRDGQVKLRGHRIELGDVETALRACEGVREAVAVVRGISEGGRLVGYVTGKVEAESVQRALGERLPPYMMPSVVVVVPALPLRPSGKVDHDALPEPEWRANTALVEPRTQIERHLVAIWRDVLQQANIGVEDNFFELGGDSIVSLRIIARARELGIGLTPKQVLAHPTIAELALVAGGVSVDALREVHDELPLTPIQAWFFEQHPAGEAHYNQSILLRVGEDLSVPALESAFDALVARYDALRLRFSERDGAWRQRVVAKETCARVDVFELQGLPDWQERLEASSESLQRGLHLQDGPLLRVGYFRLGARDGRLLLVVHHLAVDGVSWRVLLGDLEVAYTQALRGEPITLPSAGTPWSAWAKLLAEYASRPEVAAEVRFWQTSLSSASSALPRPWHDSAERSSVGESIELSFELDADATRRLLDAAARAYRAGVDEVLLAALARSLAGPDMGLLVDVEGHGREDLVDGADVGRTVGWFTTQYPVWLDAAAGVNGAVRAVKERLRSVPHRGAHFGLLRYAAGASTRDAMKALPCPEVSFNYLGRFDGSLAADGRFSLAREAGGSPAAASSRLSHALDVNALVEGGALRVSLRYDPARLDAADASALVSRFDAAVREIVAHAPGADGLPDAADFLLADIRQSELDALGLDLADVEDIYPATPLQQGLLFHALIERAHEAGAYVNQLAVTMRGPLDREAFRAAWHAAVGRHAILRTHFEWRHGGEALQIVRRHAELPWEEYDESSLPPGDLLAGDGAPARAGGGSYGARLAAFLRADLARGFDVRRAPLMRLSLIARPDGDHDVVWTSHHVLLDGWSVSRLLGEVLVAYRGGALEPAPPFRHYVAWLRGRPDASAWWREKLAGVDGAAGLLDSLSASAGGRVGEAGRYEQRLGEALTARLVAAARRNQVTLHTMVQAAWAVVLSRHADRADVVFGTTVAGRPAELPGVERMLGLFINTLPVRVRVPTETRIGAWLRELQQAFGAFERHEHAPLHEVQRWAGRPGAALFDTLLIFENYPLHEALGGPSGELSFEGAELVDRTHYPLTLSIAAVGALEVTWAWSTGPIERDAVERLASHLAVALEQLSFDEPHVREVSLRAPRTDATPLLGYAFRPVHERVAEQAARQPDAIAVSSAGRHVTYAQLVAWSFGIARRLVGVEREGPVALCVERGVALPAALLGVLAAGAAYVPLDPAYPIERLRYMLDDAHVAHVVADRASATKLSALFEGRYVVLVDDEGDAKMPDVDRRPASVHAEQVAYVLYTSGSTGAPKGVSVSHEALDRFLASTGQRPGLGPDDLWLSVTSPSFDISALEIYLPLVSGARVEIAPRETVADPAALAALLEASRATVMQATPTTWRALVESGWRAEGALVALSGGEALADDLAAELLERGVTLWNMYGPTETTIWSSAARVEPGRRITLGKPLHDTVFRVLDARGEPAPTGGLGELCIGGTNLARGYFGRAGQTADRFVPDPLGAPGARLYRTGDRCRLGVDGAVEFLGRLDDQVKLRGHRIELGEIEAALRSLPGVCDAVVVVKAERGRPGHERLVGYVTGEADPAALRAALAAKLPAVMVPSAIAHLEALPTTPNGKIARASLPGVEPREAFVAPHTPTEVALARLWVEVLGHEFVSARDDFFAAGGHSITAVRLQARIRRELDRDVPLRAFFERPIFADLAAAIDRAPRAHQTPLAPRSDRGRPLPLSFAQERLWFLWKLEPASAAYTVGGALRLEGKLDVPALRVALAAIVTRHESLRTRFETDAIGGPVQIVGDAPVYEWAEHDVGSLSNDEFEARRSAAMTRPFDLERGPLFRAELWRRAPREHTLVLTMHHIVSDGASVDRFLAELSAEYAAAQAGQLSALAPLAVQYGDYALWERSVADEAAVATQLAYWRERLGGEAPSLELPADRKRRGGRNPRGGRVTRELDSTQLRAIDALARKVGATRFVTLLAALDVLLYRYAGEREVRVGVPVSGRGHVETEPLIGLFVNTLVHRAELRAAMPFSTLLGGVREDIAGALANQGVPFARVVEAQRPARSLGQTPLFRATFNYEEDERPTLALPGLSVSPLPSRSEDVAFDLMFDVASSSGRLRLSCGYAEDIFDRATVGRLLDDYVAILEAVSVNAEVRLGEISPHTPPLSTPTAAYAFESVTARFARQVARRPDTVALTFAGQQLTYRELDAWSTSIGRRLRSLGVGREGAVGVCIERSASVVAAILGVLKAGAAYVPLDPRYPEGRLRDTLQSANARCVLVDASSGSQAAARPGLEVVDVSTLPRVADDEGWHVPVRAGELAYVIYTSGSTGRPKGVGVTHANVARLFDATVGQFAFGPSDVWTLFHSPAFDFSVWEIFGPLVSGGRLVVVPYETTRDPNAFHRLLAAERVTVLNQTPSAFGPLMHVDLQADAPLRDTRVVIFGGEKLDPALLSPWAAARGERLPALVNMYGITETTVHVTHRRLAPVDLDPERARSVIGAPIDDLEIHTFDESMGPVPVNGVGELYIGGAGLARGYLGQPGLTASRFVPDPRGNGRRLYASGDRARRLAGGDLEYIGRDDAQVKVRGHRIELGEIEAALRAHPAVREAAVVARDITGAGARLVAYVVPGAEVSSTALRSHLAERLPGHMVPASVVLLATMPLTANGKLDRASLPAPVHDESSGATAPRTETEVRVASAFAEVLGVPVAFAESDFFHLGGDSLAAVRLAAKLSDELGRRVEVAAVFERPTVEGLARHIDEARAADAGAVTLMNDWLDALT